MLKVEHCRGLSNMDKKLDEVRNTYNLTAKQYVEEYFDELKNKPIDRKLLKEFAEMVKNKGLIADLGCGPGQITRFLYEQGLDVKGYDLSPELVKHASELTPEIEFYVGNMFSLDIPDESFPGITAFYCIVHIPLEQLNIVFSEIYRVLKSGGILLLSFHTGKDFLRIDELWGQKVAVDFYHFEVPAVEDLIEKTGFVHLETVERPPYDGFEYNSNRAYIFAQKTGNK